jgi:diazepam-binding inhibitor (GABA receptor modulating acyl-CoA-binding protein)
MREPPKILIDTFLQSTKDVGYLLKKPDDDILLELYGYYKQANDGNNKASPPSIFNFRGTAKWNAWLKLKNMSKETAMVKYIKLVDKLKENE